jgi:hypothetical protein
MADLDFVISHDRRVRLHPAKMRDKTGRSGAIRLAVMAPHQTSMARDVPARFETTRSIETNGNVIDLYKQ